MTAKDYRVTPDGRYFVVRGRLWRRSNLSLPEQQRAALVGELMGAGRAVGVTLRAGDKARIAETRAQVDHAQVALGERGPAWWQDGTPDLNRHMVANTPYADWLREQDRAP